MYRTDSCMTVSVMSVCVMLGVAKSLCVPSSPSGCLVTLVSILEWTVGATTPRQSLHLSFSLPQRAQLMREKGGRD